MAKSSFNVLVLHGHGRDWMKVRSFVQEAGYTARVMKEQVVGGVLFNRFRSLVWKKAHCAVVVMTRDDTVGAGEKHYRARQNVVFELGYCFGTFDSLDKKARYKAEHAVIVIEEEGVERFANIEGLLTIQFKPGQLEAQRAMVLKALRRAFNRAKDFYGF